MEIIYEDNDLQVFNKPAGVNCDDFKNRIHRLDKDTSGIFLVAKNKKALEFFQKKFLEKEVRKKYLALVIGHLKNNQGKIETLLGRAGNDRRKQKIFSINDPGAKGKRLAITKYKVLQNFKDYDLIEAEIETGRKHQIRAHLAYLGHPLAGDKLYGFKNQQLPEGLTRQFLHAYWLKIKMLNREEKEFQSELPKELQNIITKLKSCQ